MKLEKESRMPDIEIHIKGSLDSDWSDWFDDLSIRQIAVNETVMSGQVADRSAVYGILSRMSSLGLTLISVNCRDEECDPK
jgi:hypothetical protein